jgi:DNA-binding CsgD family transcriptional regulator
MKDNESDVVGRAAEIERIDAMLRDLSGGTAACLALEGEPGIGKSFLLTELVRRAEQLGYLALSGAAAEFERDLPFAVWADALDAFMARETIDSDIVDELAAILPSRSSAQQLPMADERYRTHRAMRRLLEALAADRPVVVVLDDLHWADHASLELIAALLHREPEAPVLLGLGYRTGGAPETVASALAGPIVQRIVLGPLSQTEAASLTGATLSAKQQEAIYADSGGNPFYTLQLARTASLPPRRADVTFGGEAGVPDVVAAALLEELRTLSTAARLLLEAAAVAGDPVEPELAMTIATLDPQSGFLALDELLDADLLRSTPIPHLFAFRHPLVRRAVYAATKGGWRLLAHGRAAEALAAHGASVIARAHHIERSARPGNAAAVGLLVEAAQASEPTSPRGAARWFGAALRLTPEIDAQTRLDILLQLSVAQRAAGEPAQCLRTLQDALDLVPDGAVGMELQLTAGCAACEVFLGHNDAAQARLEKALARLPDEPSPEAATLLFHLAAVGWFANRMELMQEMAARSLEVAESLGDNALIGAAAAALALASTVLGQMDRAEPSRARAAELLLGLSDEELALRLEALTYLGWTEFYLERFESASHHISRGLAVARATGQGAFIPFMEECQAVSELLLGNMEAAEKLRDNAIEAARLAGVDYVTSTAMATSAIVRSVQGDAEGSRRDATEALRLAGSLPGFVTGLGGASLLLAAVETESTYQPARATVEAAGGWELALLPPSWRVAFHERLIEGLLAAGGTERAEQCAALAEADAATVGLPLSRSLALHARATMQLAGGDPRAAAETALAAAELATSVAARIEAARCRALAGEALAVAGDQSEGVALLRAAENELGRCGALKARNLARRALRRFGARVEPRGPGAQGEVGLAALTQREREVADLVTARKKNREIAAALFLSEKTVETHLRNIFFKLDVTSRTGVARLVEATTGDLVSS